MFLKSLTLKGFKSFADPSTLLLEPGVTVVVGPNGSGKSNVVDAVAWVLGAQGPRTVRSSKMEDVIFAGSADRPQLGRAEVSLTIDNRTGKLPGGLAEITITRTLFRSGESEYAINGQPCRLLDIQELLSDSGVGRQQHVIVSQGQLGAILDSRPEDRRAVIEEAAGVLKHRRRRERAERRLAATEENLDRLGDLLREVKRQIRPLERQAASARSHASLAEELRALRLHLVGREIAGLDKRRRSATEERGRLTQSEQTLVAAITELDAAAEATAAELATQREEDLVVALTRVQGLAERCRGLLGVVAERRRSIARALEASADTDVVSTLEADAARLTAELAATTHEDDALAPQAEEVRRAEHALASDVAAHEASFTDLAGQHAAEEAYAMARGRIEPLRSALEREQGALARAEQRLQAIDVRRHALEAEATDLAQQLRAMSSEHPRSVRRAEQLHGVADDAERGLRDAEDALRGAERQRHRLEARAEALARQVADESAGPDAQVLSEAAGVLGVLRDLVDVDEGWVAGFEAAVGAALSAIVVEGSGAARAVLSTLHDREVVGTVLPATSVGAWSSGAGNDELTDAGGSLPEGAEVLRRHVRPRVPALTGVLDDLLHGVVGVRGDWARAVEVALDRPGSVVVSTDGDRFSAAGWVVRAGAHALATLASQATVEADMAAEAAERASSFLDQARRRAVDALAQAADATHQAERAEDQRQALEVTRGRVQSELELAGQELGEADRHRVALAERLERDGAQLATLSESLPELEASATAAAGRLATADEARRRLEQRRSHVAVLRRDLEVKVAGLVERRALLSSRLGDTERRLAGNVDARERAGERRRRLEAGALATDRLGAEVQRHAERLGELLEGLRVRRSQQLDDVRAGGARLESLRKERAEADTRLADIRQRAQHLELQLAEATVRRDTAVEALRRDLGCEPEEAMGAPCPELPEGEDPARRAAVVERELASLGPVNPLALEELGALEERHRFLEEQVEDVRRARRELHQVIRAVDDEIMRVFAQAFADVNEHFQVLVGTLFPGGTGRLTLTDATDLLDTGVEVEARPAGKNVRKLSLLSGGERSLVALAFLFAVFRSRPSPFYLLDEVEAALDDVNLHRFLDLLHEFRGEAQLIIVSHQKRTMEAADALYGVTMTPGGSSKVVSQKVRREPSVVEPAPTPA
ncbi:MAG TPA: chromosome segregation protein SMC [Acidimicrobiales bacterium]